MTPGKILIFSAPSGSGKTTIVNYLRQQDLNFYFSISATSRPPRGTEQNGVEYFFLSVEEFRKRIANNEFLEYEEVYENCFYGTLKAQIESQLEAGKNVIFDVDVKGGINIKKFYGDRALSIFIQAPSIEELRHRLEGRGTDTPKVIEERIAKATYELSFANQFDVIIINDDLIKAESETLVKVQEFLTAKKKVIGIFGGTFNPIHKGHTALAQYICDQGLVDELWLMVSPQNPFKRNDELLDENIRFELTQLAVCDMPKLHACDFEFHLPRPSYTYITLQELSHTFPEYNFALIIGGDNWDVFSSWRNSDEIITNYQVIVYPRSDASIPSNMSRFSNCHFIAEAPLFHISSTDIRHAISQGNDVTALLAPSVYKRILELHLYDAHFTQETTTN